MFPVREPHVETHRGDISPTYVTTSLPAPQTCQEHSQGEGAAERARSSPRDRLFSAPLAPACGPNPLCHAVPRQPHCHCSMASSPPSHCFSSPGNFSQSLFFQNVSVAENTSVGVRALGSSPGGYQKLPDNIAKIPTFRKKKERSSFHGSPTADSLCSSFSILYKVLPFLLYSSWGL